MQQRHIYVENKEKQLSYLQARFEESDTQEQRYKILSNLYEEYRLFNADSSLHVVRELYETAQRTSNKEYIVNARLNMAEVLGVAGMFTEALDILKDIQVPNLPKHLLPYYYHICRTIYGYMDD